MKNVLFILSAVLLASGISGCSDKGGETVKPLEVVKATREFDARGGEGTIELNNVNGELKADPVDNWCRIKSTAGNIITFEVDYTLGNMSRSTVISITSSSGKQEVSISQQGLVFTIEPTIDMLGITFVGSTEKAYYTRNNSILEARPSSAPQWLTWTHEQDGLLLEFEPNTSGPRTANLTLSLYAGETLYKADVCEITITQLGLMSVDNYPGEWEISYTVYPNMRNIILRDTYNNVKYASLVAGAERISKTITLKADPSDPNKFTTELDGYGMDLEIDPQTMTLTIPGFQKAKGIIPVEGKDDHYAARGIFAPFETYDDETIFGTSPSVFMMQDRDWLKATPDSEEAQGGGVKLVYEFVSGGITTRATGMTLLASPTAAVTVYDIMLGVFKEVYDNVTMTRIYTE